MRHQIHRIRKTNGGKINDLRFCTGILIRGVSGYLKLGGQVVMWRAAAATPPLGGAFYSAKNLVGNCPLATYAPAGIFYYNASIHAKLQITCNFES